MKDYYFSPEESRAIMRRVMEYAPPGLDAEKEFHVFLECLRRNADLYASLLFGKGETKLIDFNLTLGTAAVKDSEGNVISISLQFGDGKQISL